MIHEHSSDTRFNEFRFSPSADGSIKGGHTDPKNSEFWQVGCLGITEPCSQQCETAFLDCMNTKVLAPVRLRLNINIARLKTVHKCIKDKTS